MGQPDQQFRHFIFRLQRFLRFGERENLAAIWRDFNGSNSPVCHGAFWDNLTADLFRFASCTAKSRRLDRLLLLLCEEDTCDGDSARDPHLWIASRPQFNSPADHVLPPVPAFYERDPGKLLGKTCSFIVVQLVFHWPGCTP